MISTECLTPKAKQLSFRRPISITYLLQSNHIPPPERLFVFDSSLKTKWYAILPADLLPTQTFKVYFDPTPSMVLFDLLGILFFLCQLLPDSFDLLGHPLKSSNDGS